MDSEKTDALLAPVTFDYEKLGTALIEQAREGQREKAQKQAVAAVQGILRDISDQRRAIVLATKQVEKQDARLAALQAGKFTLNLVENVIRFDDPLLNGGGL